MRTNRSEFVSHAALKAGANHAVRAVKAKPIKATPIRLGMCLSVGMLIGTVLVIALGGAL